MHMQERIQQGSLIRDLSAPEHSQICKGSKRPKGSRSGVWGAAMPESGNCLCRIRLLGTCRRAKQFNPASLLELQQQGAGGHVFELAGSVAPVP